MREGYVYIMSNKSHRLYIGATVDLLKRVREHKERADARSFTARYKFDRLVYFEVLRSFAAALARERYLKGLVRSRKVALIQRDNPKWLDLGANLSDYLMAR